MMKIRTSLAFVAVAAALAACGSTTSASSTKVTAPSIGAATAGPCNNLDLTVPKSTPSTPTAMSCWANGIYVGNGSLKSKQIIFASKMAHLMQYEATSAEFTNPAQWAAWKTKDGQYADAKVTAGVGAQMAVLLNSHHVFSLPPGNPAVNSGLQKTSPAECQSSVVLNKNQPTPQYLVTETDVTEKDVTNGKLTTSTGSYTDILAELSGSYRLVGEITQGPVPPCAS